MRSEEQEPDGPQDERNPSITGRPGDLDHQDGVAHLDRIADPKDDLRDRHAVDPGPIRAAEVGVDERPAPRPVIRPWWRDTRGSSATRSLSVARPIVRPRRFDRDVPRAAVGIGDPKAGRAARRARDLEDARVRRLDDLLRLPDRGRRRVRSDHRSRRRSARRRGCRIAVHRAVGRRSTRGRSTTV